MTSDMQLAEEIIAVGKENGLPTYKMIQLLGMSTGMFHRIRIGERKADDEDRYRMQSLVYEQAKHGRIRLPDALRAKLDYDLITRIERTYGQLSKCPDDDVDLLRLREELRV